MAQTRKPYSWIIGGMLIGFLVSGGNNSWSKGPQNPATITISTVKYVGAAPSYIAYHKGYFKEEGLKVNLTSVSAGKLNMKRVFEGKAHIGATAETPIVYSSFDKKKYTDFERGDFYVIANMMRSTKIRGILAREDKGIKVPSDIKGKKAGVFRGTASDFLMDAFLAAHGLKASNLEIINMKPGQMVKAITAGEIDVMFSWQPHIMRAQEALGKNAVLMPGADLSTACFPLVVMKDYAEANPEIIEKVLRAFVKAEKFIKENRDQAIEVFLKATEIDRKIVTALWDYLDFDISLDQALLVQMEDQARWLIRKGYTDKTDVPNYLDYIYFDALQKVKPEGVTIIR